MAYRHVPARRAWRREILPLSPLLCREYRRVVRRCKTRDKKTARTWRRDCARQLICAIARNNYRYRYCFCLGKMPSRRTGSFLLQGKRQAGERTRDERCLPFPMRLVGHHNVERQSASYPVSTVPRRKRRRAAVPRRDSLSRTNNRRGECSRVIDDYVKKKKKKKRKQVRTVPSRRSELTYETRARERDQIPRVSSTSRIPLETRRDFAEPA